MRHAVGGHCALCSVAKMTNAPVVQVLAHAVQPFDTRARLCAMGGSWACMMATASQTAPKAASAAGSGSRPWQCMRLQTLEWQFDCIL